MSSATIAYPRPRSNCTTARPMPPAAPVTSATGTESLMSGYRHFPLSGHAQNAVVTPGQADLRHMQAVGVLARREPPEQLGLVERHHPARFAANPGQRVVDRFQPDRLAAGGGADGFQHTIPRQALH